MPAQEQPTRQQAADLALAADRGEVPKWQLKGLAKEMYDTLSMDELRAFADGEPNEIPGKTD